MDENEVLLIHGWRSVLGRLYGTPFWKKGTRVIQLDKQDDGSYIIHVAEVGVCRVRSLAELNEALTTRDET